MHISRIRSLTSLFVFAILIASGCSSPTSTPQLQKLAISTGVRDTISMVTGQTFSMSLEVTADSQAVKGATITYHDPIVGQTKVLGPTEVTGLASFTDSISTDMPSGVYAFTFVATKAGFVQSDTLRRYVKVTLQPKLLLLVLGSDTTNSTAGASYSYQVVVTANGAAANGAIVTLKDLTQGQTSQGLTINGTTTFNGAINPSTRGTVSLIFFATQPGMMASDTVHKYIVIPGSRTIRQMNVRASSQSSSSIGVRWDRVADNGTDTVVAVSNGVVAAASVAQGGSSSVVLEGLTAGVIYSISVHTPSELSENLSWATAKRLGPVRIYETADNTPGQFAGLELSSGSPINISASSPNRRNADVVLSSDVTSLSGLSLVAASVTGLSGIVNGKNTRFSNSYEIVGGLNGLYYTSDLSTLVPTSGKDTANAYDIPQNVPADRPIVVHFFTEDEHFARIEILPQSNGSYYGGTAGQRYIDVNISYQTVATMPYASRGHSRYSNVAKRANRTVRQ